ncbi:WG repeat-containing protein [Neobacillus drentensis]|uniref:WG repeat-containing protein n=1 Tax=Neobacillus drentensis TaxID=220684 RepID=UPI002FFDFABB
MSEKTYPHSLVYTADLDGDGIREIIGAYNWEGNSYFLILKFYGNAWVVVANCLAESHIKHNPFLVARETQLYTASVKTARGNYWGYINENGVMVIPPQYEFAFDFQDNGLAIVQINDHFGVIDQVGRYVVKPVYDSINPFSEGRAIVLEHHDFYVIDETGKILTPNAFEFIGDYHEGRALFHQLDDQEDSKYGYLDLQGREVIPPQYQAANNFTEGKALVKIKDSVYAMIGLNGERLATFNYPYVGMRGEGLLAFQEETNGKYGYIDEDGNVVISPRFEGAQPFRDGRAVVYKSEDHRKKSGLIGKDGNYILTPEFNDILLLGEQRAAIGKAIDEKQPFIGSKYAIANTNGNFLTEYRFFGVMEYVYGIASVYDNSHTFFINRSGKTVQNLPKVPGSGALTLIGNVVQSNVDQRLSYFDHSGKVIWKQNTIIPLMPPYLIKEEKYKSNKDYFVYFPQVEGMANKAAQNKVNEKLRGLSQLKNVPSNVELDYSYTGDFAVTFIEKNLLVLELNGYLYQHGHAHGMPNQIHTHINLINGHFYKLKDLFKQHSNYVEVLSNIIGKQIQNDPQYSYVFPNIYEGIEGNQPFYITGDALKIYFLPYEIAPYVAGFPTFTIPYKEIIDIIDTNGEFWRSFKKSY